ncbi:MAG: outer membrane protein [Vicinamibacterales bacterium]
MSRCFAAPLFFVACLFPVSAAADWIVSPYVGTRFAADTTFLVGFQGTTRDKLTFGSSVGVLSDGVLGVEADIAFVPGFFNSRGLGGVTPSRVITLMGNVILATPLGVSRYGLRPYLVGGAGLIDAAGDSNLLPDIDSHLVGMNLGAGAIGPISDRTSLRFDVRFFRSLRNDEDADTLGGGTQLTFWRGTVGLTFRF